MDKLNRLGMRLFIAVLLFVVSSGLLFIGYGLRITWLAYCALSGILLAVAWSDLNSRTIPNKYVLSAFIIWIALVLICAFGLVSGYNNGLFAAIDGLVGAVVVGGGTFLLSWLLGVTRKQTVFGAGDVKLLFVTSLFLGLKRAVISLLIACVLTLLFALISEFAMPSQNEPLKATFRSKTIPFGPAIAAATLLVLAVSPFVNQ